LVQSRYTKSICNLKNNDDYAEESAKYVSWNAAYCISLLYH
jgi:hypothetical protein